MRRAMPSRPQRLLPLLLAALLGAALTLLLTWRPASREAANVGNSKSTRHWECQRKTVEGVCVTDFFAAVDDAYRDQWPGSVDLLLRSHTSEKFFLLETLFQSIELLWPKGIGDTVLVLDKGEHRAQGLIPCWVQVHFEENHLQLPGKVLQQWSYGWADKYTSADFVAIVDDDIIFIMKVTPPLLFNLTEGAPYIIGSSRHQRKVWAQATNYLVGKDSYAANFMVHLPFLVPRGAFSAFRGRVGSVQPAGRRDYDRAFQWFSRHAKPFGRDQIQHSALGNYLFHFWPKKVHIALEWTDHTPIPRVAAHVPWTMKFYAGTNFTDYSPKVTALYVEVASHYAMEGLCSSFPPGELPGCEGLQERQNQVWRYALDWDDWPMIFKTGSQGQGGTDSAQGTGNSEQGTGDLAEGTVVYDEHVRVMRCMYQQFLQTRERGVSGVEDVKFQSKVAAMQSCLSH